MNLQRITVFLALLLLSVCTLYAGPIEVKSPDGKVVATFDLQDLGGAKGCPIYRVDYEGRPVIASSRLGLELKEADLSAGLSVVSQSRTSQDATWQPLCGERSTIHDHCNQLVLDLKQDAAPQRLVRLTFRAYDAGAAFCYTLPAQDGLNQFTITKETTQFAFTGDYTTWAVYSAQGNYDGGEVTLAHLKPGVERPLTVRIADDLYASITEAKVIDYARMKLRLVKGQEHTLEAFLDAERGKYGEVVGSAPFSSPWRVIMVAPSPGKLLENNDIILNLNDPCALSDVSWIKPGKVIREASLTTKGGRACVDFCLEHGLQYIEYDAGWYGFEYDKNSDARDVHLDPKRNPNPNSLNLHEVIDYASAHGIGVILYVNHLAMEKQLDEILPIYEKWGVKGVKYGFVNVGSQHWTSWLHEAIRKAAAHHLMVDIHDEFRSTGYQRTYPNLMTVEGIGGDETFPTPTHNATLPFTRFLTGPADHTFCWYDKRLKVTHAHQLAISTIFFGPWQFLYWYDKPAMYDGDAALDYWKYLPTTWDDTRVISGEIARSVCVARRKGDEWYIGAIHAAGRETMQIPLAFLDAGRKYEATVYTDQNPDDPLSKAVKVQTLNVDAGTRLTADIPSNGGCAVRVVPTAAR